MGRKASAVWSKVLTRQSWGSNRGQYPFRKGGTLKCEPGKVGLRVDIKQFAELHKNSVKLMRSYFAEVEKTSGMLSRCSPEPLSLFKRFAILRQEIAENDAQQLYFLAKILLHDAARLGYAAT
jgi:hypothetical protein